MSNEYWEKKLLKYKTKYEKLEKTTMEGGTNVVPYLNLLSVDDFPPNFGKLTQTMGYTGREAIPDFDKNEPGSYNIKGEKETRKRVQIVYEIVQTYKLPSLSGKSANTSTCVSKSNLQYRSVPSVANTIYNPHKKTNVCFNKVQYSLLVDYYTKDNDNNDSDRYHTIWKAIRKSEDIHELISILYSPNICPFVSTNDPATTPTNPINYKNIIIFLDRLGSPEINFGFYEVYNLDKYLNDRFTAIEDIQLAAAQKAKKDPLYDFTKLDKDVPIIPPFDGNMSKDMWTKELFNLPRFYNLDRKIIAIFKKTHIKANYKCLRGIAVSQVNSLINDVETDVTLTKKQDEKDVQIKQLRKYWFSESSIDIIMKEMKSNKVLYEPSNAVEPGIMETAINNAEQYELDDNKLAIDDDIMWKEIFFRLCNKIKFLCSVGNEPVEEGIYTNSTPTKNFVEKNYYRLPNVDVNDKDNYILEPWDIQANKRKKKGDGKMAPSIEVSPSEFNHIFQFIVISEEKKKYGLL